MKELSNEENDNIGVFDVIVIDCDAVYGYVNYGTINSETNGGYYTKMRCRKCGAFGRASVIPIK